MYHRYWEHFWCVLDAADATRLNTVKRPGIQPGKQNLSFLSHRWGPDRPLELITIVVSLLYDSYHLSACFWPLYRINHTSDALASFFTHCGSWDSLVVLPVADISFHWVALPLWDSTTSYISTLLWADIGLFSRFVPPALPSLPWFLLSALVTIFVLISWCP